MAVQAPKPVATFDFEPEKLRAYLLQHRPELKGDMRVERIGSGQSNPTYFIDFDNASLVLRKRPVGDLPAAAHDVKREFRALGKIVGRRSRIRSARRAARQLDECESAHRRTPGHRAR